MADTDTEKQETDEQRDDERERDEEQPKGEEREEQSDGDGDGNGKRNVGRIEEIQGVVIEAVFPDKLPEINYAIVVPREGSTPGEEEGVSSGTQQLVCEVQQHLGDDRVRAVAMDTTDGLQRGTEVVDTGGPITAPVGKDTPRRLFNLLGETSDQGGDAARRGRWPSTEERRVGRERGFL